MGLTSGFADPSTALVFFSRSPAGPGTSEVTDPLNLEIPCLAVVEDMFAGCC